MRGKGQVSELDCRTAESMVNRYIDHTLNVDELEEFLDHVESCPSCYDELETYFIVHEVTQQLDEQENGTVLDFKDLLTQDIRRARRYIHKKRAMKFGMVLLMIVFTGSLVAFFVFIIFQLGINL